MILYLTLTVAPNSDISHWRPNIILNTWEWYYIWHWRWHPWVLIIFENQKKSSCSICPYSSYSNSFHNISYLPVFILLIFTTPCVSLCSPYIFLQHLMFACVHPNSFCNIPYLLVFVLPIFTTSHVCLCLPYLYLQHPVSPRVHYFYNIQCLPVFILIILNPFVELIEYNFIG